MLELRHLRTFVTVAASSSMTAAARQLNLAQPAVSQHIHFLEIDLGAVLFHRSSRGVRLTDAGVALLGPARALLEGETDLRASFARLSQERRAEVQIAAVASAAEAILPRALLLLREAAAPTVRLFERPTGDSLALLAARVVELAIVREYVDSSGFAREEILVEPLVVVVGSRSLAEDLSQLRRVPFIVFDRNQTSSLYSAAMAACAAAGFVPRLICEGAEVGSMGAMISAGVGFGIVPRSIARLWSVDHVRLLRAPVPVGHSSLYIVTLPGGHVSPEAAAVMRAIRRVATTLGKKLDEGARDSDKQHR